MTLFEMASTIACVDQAMIRAGVLEQQRRATLNLLGPSLARLGLQMPPEHVPEDRPRGS